MRGKIILTSTGITPEIAKENLRGLIPYLKNKFAVIITTAAKDKENNKWNIKTREDLLSLGYEKVDFIDLEITSRINLQNYSTVYVCGGNTFKLLNYVHKSNFKDEVIKLLSNGGLYIGASAGAIITTPTIAIAGEVEPDENEVNLTNLKGMNLIDFEILPHYEESQDPQIQKYKSKTTNEVKLISNNDILIIDYEKQ